MEKTYIQVLLLCSLFFNVTHASFMAVADDCHTESVHEYILEQSVDTDCGDLCDLHHLFHFVAIIDTPILNLENMHYRDLPMHKAIHYTPPFKQTNIKPPIA